MKDYLFLLLLFPLITCSNSLSNDKDEIVLITKDILLNNTDGFYSYLLSLTDLDKLYAKNILSEEPIKEDLFYQYFGNHFKFERLEYLGKIRGDLDIPISDFKNIQPLYYLKSDEEMGKEFIDLGLQDCIYVFLHDKTIYSLDFKLIKLDNKEFYIFTSQIRSIENISKIEDFITEAEVKKTHTIHRYK